MDGECADRTPLATRGIAQSQILVVAAHDGETNRCPKGRMDHEVESIRVMAKKDRSDEINLSRGIIAPARGKY